MIFRRDDKKKKNVKVYIESLENFGVVYKIGVEIDVIDGVIYSFEFYNVFLDEDN